MKEKLLRIYLIIFGLLNVFFISFTFPILFGEQMLWHPRNEAVEMMVGVIYFSMGIIMVAIQKNPIKHKALIDFLIISNTLHGIIMILYAEKMEHIWIDAIPIGLMGVLPLLFYPWGIRRFLSYKTD